MKQVILYFAVLLIIFTAGSLKSQTAEEFLQKRKCKKRRWRFFKGAITDYTSAINLKQDYIDAYYNRGLAKDNFRHFHGSIADYNKVIEWILITPKAYNSRVLQKLI